MGLFSSIGNTVSNITKNPASAFGAVGGSKFGPIGTMAGWNIPKGKNPLANPFDTSGGGGDTSSGSPVDFGQYPAYTPGYDPSTMAPENSATIKPFLSEATRRGPSSWLNMAKGANAVESANALDNARNASASETAGAHNMLASTGGLSSGARERVAESGQKNFINMAQETERTRKGNDLKLMLQDESNHLNMLGQLPGIGQTDIANRLTDNARKNDYNMRALEAKWQAMAAERQAQATERSGGGGLFGGKGFLGLGI